ncbi:MAG TPA: DUF3786 domain-containing protein [Bacillota bacterium]|jgi:hypothetical protein|nr:DUF3786 domain-containing protein [Bacillota bacterium]HOB86114.1 DUF3786 domain-containing protein [Bacillota bacterium]HOP68677.1 DUF3786 domain-containing protein [Bacillota bacterium]HPT34200.1 DUF3786 domain-containing protein [Bacillota bacterium]HPZ65465.1 DUF3786 domain-containing protein [Bacillota bacterium]
MTNNYQAVLEKARREFAEKNCLEMARFSGAGLSLYAPLSWREFTVPLLGRLYRVLWPTGEVFQYGTNKEASLPTSILLLHYLSQSKGSPAHGRWIPFNQLWGGSSFFNAYRKRALEPLADFFGKRRALFRQLLELRLNARPGKVPETFLFIALPRLPLLVRLDSGDGEAPSRATILFDAGANEYLPTEDLAVLAELFTARMLRWGREQIAKNNR